MINRVPSSLLRNSLLVLATLIFTYPAANNAAQEKNTTDLDRRLKNLVAELEQKRQQLHIPGLSIAVVKGDKTLLNKGLGLVNLEKKTPATSDSIYAIGSTTKAFTATLAAMLVDEKKLDWDAPLVTYLPKYKFEQDDLYKKLNLRDALSHRSGYSRNDFLWASGRASKNEILDTASQAEPYAPFREQFHYNNVMYLAAGEASAKVSKTAWDTLLQSKILSPLGMQNTFVSFDRTKKNDKMALGYIWNEYDSAFEHQAMRNIDKIAPAGAINSSVNDMAKWLKFLLREGKKIDRQLVSLVNLIETQTAQVQVSPDMDYGMGWFIRDWNGQMLLEHGGNIDGFSAQVALLPQSDLAFVMLTNVSVTPLQQMSINLVWDHLLGESRPPLSESELQNTSRYDKYLGDYVANFGPFNDALFKVLVQNGRLAIDIPGQTTYELKEPDDQGQWQFAMTDTVAISFNTEGEIVVGVNIHQAGTSFEAPRKGLTLKNTITGTDFSEYAGTYHSKELDKNIKAFLKGPNLALDIPGQMVFDLNPPNEKGLWTFTLNPSLAARFDRDENSKITALTFFQGNQKTGQALRLSNSKNSALPSVKELFKLMGLDSQLHSFTTQKGVCYRGTAKILQSGITGTIETCFDQEVRFRTNMDFGIFGYVQQVLNTDRAALISDLTPFFEFKGKYLSQMQEMHPQFVLTLSQRVDKASIERKTTHKGLDVYVLKIADANNNTRKLFVDTKTGNVVKEEMIILDPAIGQMPFTIEYSQFKTIGGLSVPHKMTTHDPMIGYTEIEFTEIETGIDFSDTKFALRAEK